MGAAFGPQSIPCLKPHVRLQHNKTRDQWVIQAPERVLMPDEIAVAVLKRCDGRSTIAAIAAALAAEFQAPVDIVLSDVCEMLRDLAEKGVVADASL